MQNIWRMEEVEITIADKVYNDSIAGISLRDLFLGIPSAAMGTELTHGGN